MGACAVIIRAFNRSIAVSGPRDPLTLPFFCQAKEVDCDLLDMTASLSLYKSADSDDRGRSVHENCDAAIVPNETRTLFPNEKTNHALFHIATPLYRKAG